MRGAGAGGRRHRGYVGDGSGPSRDVFWLGPREGPPGWCRRWHLVVTVRGPAESVESRLAAGALRCPCGGVLAPWGHARRRLVAVPEGWREFWPRRSRCRSCGRTHVLLPADLWSRRRYGAAVIMAVLVLAAQAAAAGRAAARPWLAVPGGSRRQVPASTARSWRARFAARAGVLREQLARLLGRLALSGQLYLRYFMLRAAGSGTRRGLLAESCNRVPSGDACNYSGSRCTGQCPPVLSFASGTRSGAPARPSPPR